MKLDTTACAAAVIQFGRAASRLARPTVVDTTPSHARSCGESGTVRRLFPKQRPNQPCLCESGRKAKHCCR